MDATLANTRLEQVKDHLRVETDPQKRTEFEQEQAALAADLTRRGMMQSSLQGQVEALRQQIAIEQSNLADTERKLDQLDR